MIQTPTDLAEFVSSATPHLKLSLNVFQCKNLHENVHCCDQVILQPCKMNYVKPQILYSIFLHAKQRILQAPKFHWKF